MKQLVIIPTYNERENTEAILAAVFALEVDVDILVVDDNSPDGTGQLVADLQKKWNRLHLLSRPGKRGLGRAYLAAFRWALEKGYDIMVEMDADFSHRPEDLRSLLAAIPSCDFAVGSRYTQGGGTKNWGLMRKLISRSGSLYARCILGYKLWDWTGGFNVWRRQVLEGIDLDQVQSEGYSFQIELKYRSLRRGFRVLEVPILFEDRRVGKSKMSPKIAFEAFYRVWVMRATS